MFHITEDIYLDADNGFARIGRTRLRTRKGRQPWREFIRPQDFYTLAGAKREAVDMMTERAMKQRDYELEELMKLRAAIDAEISAAFERVPDELIMEIRMERLNRRKKEGLQ